jgi:hypothetical protein
MVKKSKVLSILFIASIIFLGYLWLNQTKSQSSQPLTLDQIFKDQYKGKYLLKNEPIGDTNVIVVTSNTAPDTLEGGYDPYDEKASPMIIIQDANTEELKAVYEIVFDRKNTKEFNTGNIVRPQQIEFKDIDGDNVKELITEWDIYWGGSGGLIGLAVFKQEGNTFIPVTGYPSEIIYPGTDSSLLVTEKKSNNKLELPVIGTSQYEKFVDLNTDGKVDFLYASYDWLPEEEGHFGPHHWDLRAFEFKDNKYQIASWWNEGKEFKTKEKIGFEDLEQYKIYESFTTLTKK